jgi:hypothetical protein
MARAVFPSLQLFREGCRSRTGGRGGVGNEIINYLYRSFGMLITSYHIKMDLRMISF